MYPSGFRYTKDHEWIEITGSRGRVGITDYAQHQLGDVVYVELPEVGKQFSQGQTFGTIESVKAVSELYCPMSGKVVEVNKSLMNKPEAINHAPHESWIMVLEISDQAEAGNLLDNAQYEALVK